jgi:hypothetical protein
MVWLAPPAPVVKVAEAGSEMVYAVLLFPEI